MTGLTTEEIEAVESLLNMSEETYKMMETASPLVVKTVDLVRKQFS